MLRWGKLEVTGGFMLLMAWLNYIDTQGLLPLGVCAAAAHETGHWLVIRLCHGRVSRLRLSAVGAQMRVVGTVSYFGELCCTLAGPVVNLLLGYVSAQLGWLVFAGMSLALGLFNLLPVGPLDGGRALRCVVSMLGYADGAARVQRWADGALAFAFAVLGVMLSGKGAGTTLVVIGVWLLFRFCGESDRKLAEKGLVKAAGNR